jgi:SAM-dependent MidA family methyltransferase
VLAETGGAILEFGAGSGALATGLISALDELGAPLSAYFILEVSADLRQRQEEALAALPAALRGRVQWLDRLPAAGFRGVVIANEVLDAMPVHRFTVAGGVAREVWVTADGEGFAETLAPPAGDRLAARLAELVASHGLPDGYTSECNLAAEDWVTALAGVLEAGAVFAIDYGFPAAEYHHPQRREGTLMCHYRHRAHGDPYYLPGLQDITAHVDFTAVAEAAAAAGLQVAGFATQASFLLATGISEALEQAAGDDARRRLELAAAVKRLLMPHEMGELFKVLALTRGVEGPLLGFALRDERVRLAQPGWRE